MLSRFSMHSAATAARGLSQARPAAPAAAALAAICLRWSSSTAPAPAAASAEPVPESKPASIPTTQDIAGDARKRLPYKRATSTSYQRPSGVRRGPIPYVPPSQGGTTIAESGHLSVQGSNAHFSAGQLYTPSDLDESQRMGSTPPAPTLSTIQFDVFKAMGTDPLKSYKDTTLLSNFVTETGMLMHRKHTKLSAKNQRKLTKAVKRARAMGLMPYTYRMEPHKGVRNPRANDPEFLNLSPRY